jgi:hypothetical protein
MLAHTNNEAPPVPWSQAFLNINRGFDVLPMLMFQQAFSGGSFYRHHPPEWGKATGPTGGERPSGFDLGQSCLFLGENRFDVRWTTNPYCFNLQFSHIRLSSRMSYGGQYADKSHISG